jgi:hypothetical protein
MILLSISIQLDWEQVFTTYEIASTSGHNLSSPATSPDDTNTENADDEDPSLENQDNVGETLYIKMKAPPENQ